MNLSDLKASTRYKRAAAWAIFLILGCTIFGGIVSSQIDRAEKNLACARKCDPFWVDFYSYSAKRCVCDTHHTQVSP